MRALVRGMALMVALSSFVGARLAAQQEKGDKEVQLFFTSSYTKATGGPSTTSTTIGLIVGYFITAPLELRVGMVGNGTTTSGGGGTTGIFSFTPGVTYSFIRTGQKTVPYLGIDAYFSAINSPGGTVNNSSVRPNGGAKYFISRNAAIDLNIGYTSYSGFKVLDERVGVVVVF